jgi:DNA-binding NtrC family response regulator
LVDPLSLLRFNAGTGHIWLDEQRMLLLHTRALASLRQELFDSLGVERTRGLLIRMGFASGQHDGELAVKRRRAGLATRDAFLLGPKLHSIEGVAGAQMVTLEIDLQSGHFFAECLWENSWEDEADVADLGFGEEPACWTQIGYASGYSSAFMGRLMIFKEVECRALGDARCRIVGQPAEKWDDAHYLGYFKPQAIGSQLAAFDADLEQVRAVQPRRQYDKNLVGVSSGFKEAFELLQRAAPSAITVLLLGETGVGKEMFARWLHDSGPRAKGPFIAVNCAAIPHELVEAELFGVEKGAYTGAQLARAGRFERASAGTHFLDEVGDLPLAAQAKLLRALQTGEVERLGAEQATKTDVRVVCATNVDLGQAIRDGRFRNDLYYRLSTFPITIPALRDRKADIPVLVTRFVEKYAGLYRKAPRGLSDKAMGDVMSHHWPGNIRELENVIERAVLLAEDGSAIESRHLFGKMPWHAGESGVDANGQITQGDGPDTLRHLCDQALTHQVGLQSLERQLMLGAMQRAGGNLSQAARLLGITRPQLAYRLKREGLLAPERRT